MRFESFMQRHTFALSEGSIYERLRRHPDIQFDPYLAHAALIYDTHARQILEQIHREYLTVGQRTNLGMFALTDTWRANEKRIRQSEFRDRRVNQDNARFIAGIRESFGPNATPIFIGGQIGPQGDAYKPEEALGEAEAEQFHTPQLEALAEGEVDFLYAATLPALTEAQGISRAMAKLDLPYVLSFIIGKDGRLLDGTPLSQAIKVIDNRSQVQPTGYAINCVHPSVFISGMTILSDEDAALTKRVISFQANTSSREPQDLDGLEELETEDPEKLAALMLSAWQQFNTIFLGGCCGTDTSHIECLASGYEAASKPALS